LKWIYSVLEKSSSCTAGSYILWAYFFAGGPGHLVQSHAIMDSSKYQQIKKSKPDCLC